MDICCGQVLDIVQVRKEIFQFWLFLKVNLNTVFE